MKSNFSQVQSVLHLQTQGRGVGVDSTTPDIPSVLSRCVLLEVVCRIIALPQDSLEPRRIQNRTLHPLSPDMRLVLAE